MKKIILLMVLQAICLLACKPEGQSISAKQSKKSKNTANILIQLEKNRIAALTQLDSNQLKETVSTDYLFTSAYGELMNLHQLLQNYQKTYLGGMKEKHYTKGTQVNIYNNTAILRGIYIVERAENKGFVVFTTRYTDTYIKKRSIWQLVSSHQSRIKALK